MKEEIKVYTNSDGEIQRVHVVRFDDWSKLAFLSDLSKESAVSKQARLECFRDIYQNYLVPACPYIFSQMVMFHLPDNLEVDFPLQTKEYGAVADPLLAASIALKKGVKIKGERIVFSDKKIEAFWHELEKKDAVRIIRGKLPFTQIIPVSDHTGYLSKVYTDAKMKVNANFFIMDPIDCATIYDQLGVPFGLCVKNGVVENPPLFGREALLVNRNQEVCVKALETSDLEIEIGGTRFKHGKNATIYSRPNRTKTPKQKGLDLVIVGRSVVAVQRGGRVSIPASGFVLHIDLDEKIDAKIDAEVNAKMESISPGTEVIYHGLEDIVFGIQVGNSIIRDGIKTEQFLSRFYNIYHLERNAFPPSLYPMDFQKARAARIALGADKAGKPMLFWAEGAGKLGYKKGVDSCGASLSEMAEIAEDLGMHNGVNLDGGGSAQILVGNERRLLISDRNKEDNSEAERLVPLGLMIK